MYEVIPLFFADDHVVLEHHEIGKAHLEKSNDYGYLENIELDDMVDALNDGLGDRLYINSFHKSECEDVNTFINGLGIFATLKEEDFEYM